MENRSTMVALAATGICVIFAACGGADGSVSGGGTGGASTGDGAGSGTSSENGSGPSSSTGYGTDEPGGINGASSSGAGEGAGGDASCAGETSTAELVPLDLYIMLDASGSMDEPLSRGVTKWDAVTDALEAFFTDEQSVGLGVGLQYFPLPDDDVPSSCSNNAECGDNGPCALRVCHDAFSTSTQTQVCVTDADCAAGDTCVDLGVCSRRNRLCADVGAACEGNGGTCMKVTRSQCANPDSCVVEDYATPAVPITPLDATSAEVLIRSIGRKDPVGGTPTAGALSGALAQARAHAEQNPTHRVVAVLATDGMPTECSPKDADGLAGLAAGALNGTPSISTFVIGVFDGDDDGAQATLDRIAVGGGTESAFFIDTSSDVTQAFLDALTAIRGKSLACEYQVPAPSSGQTLDYDTLNVQHTPTDGGAPTTIFYVAEEARCDAAAGGWYYDVDPATGGSPTKIVMCPATCTRFQAGGQVQLNVGCKTEIPPVN
ncbi:MULTISPECIES: VWA domain-containing protein [Sorangium]|nr:MULTISPECIES: VWA domain-containing protein [Sorangium]